MEGNNIIIAGTLILGGYFIYSGTAKRLAQQIILGSVDMYCEVNSRARCIAQGLIGRALVQLDNRIDDQYARMLDVDSRSQKIISATFGGKNVTTAVKFYFSIDPTPSCSNLRLYFASIGLKSPDDILYVIHDEFGDLHTAQYALDTECELLTGTDVDFGDLSNLSGLRLTETSD